MLMNMIRLQLSVLFTNERLINGTTTTATTTTKAIVMAMAMMLIVQLNARNSLIN